MHCAIRAKFKMYVSLVVRVFRVFRKQRIVTIID